jgi:hypothetical protein
MNPQHEKCTVHRTAPRRKLETIGSSSNQQDASPTWPVFWSLLRRPRQTLHPFSSSASNGNPPRLTQYRHISSWAASKDLKQGDTNSHLGGRGLCPGGGLVGGCRWVGLNEGPGPAKGDVEDGAEGRVLPTAQNHDLHENPPYADWSKSEWPVRRVVRPRQ